MLIYFIPVTIIFTPIGQITSNYISTEMIQSVCGILLCFIFVFEVNQKRSNILSWACSKKILKSDHKSTKTSGDDSSQLEKDFDIETGIMINYRSQHSTLLDNYTVSNDILGQGGFSKVLRGENKVSGSSVAIKVVEKSRLKNSDEENITQEIKLLEDISHTHILQMVEYFDEPNFYYIVQEYMGGGDLCQYLNEITCFSEYEGQHISKSIAKALDYLHSKKIVHRDIKPENIMLQSRHKQSTVKLTDFGLAKKLSSSTSALTMCGTVSYAAPELLLSNPYDFKVDSWSLGIVTYVLLAGYLPFRGVDEDDLKRNIIKSDFCFDKQFWNDISVEAKSLIRKLLKHQPKKRISMKEVLRHKWYSVLCTEDERYSDDTNKVFFMIGSQ